MLLIANGQIISPENKSIICDRNFLHGYGVFTTLKIKNNKILYFDEHWSRLLNHAQLINIPLSLEKKQGQDYILSLLQQALIQYPNNNTFKLRIIITAGDLQSDLAQQPQHSCWYLILEPFTTRTKIESFAVTISPYPINEYSPLCGIKQCNYMPAIIAKQYAQQHGYQDALYQNTQGFIASGTTFNLFMIKNNILYTPNLQSGALAGIIRAQVIKIAQTHNIQIVEKKITLKELLTAKTVFATNSLIGIKGITKINTQKFILTSNIFSIIKSSLN